MHLQIVIVLRSMLPVPVPMSMMMMKMISMMMIVMMTEPFGALLRGSACCASPDRAHAILPPPTGQLLNGALTRCYRFKLGMAVSSFPHFVCNPGSLPALPPVQALGRTRDWHKTLPRSYSPDPPVAVL